MIHALGSRWHSTWTYAPVFITSLHPSLDSHLNAATQIEFWTPTHKNARGCHESKNNSATENTDVITTRTCFFLQWPWVATERKMFALLKVPCGPRDHRENFLGHVGFEALQRQERLLKSLLWCIFFFFADDEHFDYIHLHTVIYIVI